jgi:glutamine synthetase adenylyltransferase
MEARVKFIENILSELNHGDLKKVSEKYQSVRKTEGKDISDKGAYSTTIQSIQKLKDGFPANTTIMELLKEQAEFNKQLIKID